MNVIDDLNSVPSINNNTTHFDIDNEEQGTDLRKNKRHFFSFVSKDELCHSLGITLRDIRKLKKKFDRLDSLKSGMVTKDDALAFTGEERRPLSLGIFRFAPSTFGKAEITFDEFLISIIRFSALSKPQLYQFVFELYDDDQSGCLDEAEFAMMSRELQSQQFSYSKNLEVALQKMWNNGKPDHGGRRSRQATENLVDRDDFIHFARSFPLVFYPILNLQKNVREKSFGELFWAQIMRNKLHIVFLVKHMHLHNGRLPEVTTKEHVERVFGGRAMHLRKCASLQYQFEIRQL